MLPIHSPSLSFLELVAQHRYNTTEVDWGFNNFAKFKELLNPIDENTRPIIENDAVTIKVMLRIVEDPTGVLWHKFLEFVNFLFYFILFLFYFCFYSE